MEHTVDLVNEDGRPCADGDRKHTERLAQGDSHSDTLTKTGEQADLDLEPGDFVTALVDIGFRRVPYLAEVGFKFQ